MKISERGFSLAEVVIAAAILMIVSAAVAKMIFQQTQSVRSVGNLIDKNSIQNEIGRLLNCGNTVPAQDTQCGGCINGNYTTCLRDDKNNAINPQRGQYYTLTAICTLDQVTGDPYLDIKINDSRPDPVLKSPPPPRPIFPGGGCKNALKYGPSQTMCGQNQVVLGINPNGTPNCGTAAWATHAGTADFADKLSSGGGDCSSLGKISVGNYQNGTPICSPAPTPAPSGTWPPGSYCIIQAIGQSCPAGFVPKDPSETNDPCMGAENRLVRGNGSSGMWVMNPSMGMAHGCTTMTTVWAWCCK